MRFELKRQPSGALAVRDREFGETMHPGGGPWAEANGLYVAGSGLPALLTGPPSSAAAGPLVLFDVGLGAAANALAAIACREELARRGGSPRPLAVISFEADPEPLRFALAHAGQLGYLLGHEPKVEALLRDGRWEEPEALVWEVRWGDFPRLIGEEPQRADAIFFDPFSPRVNPDMWSVPTLEAAYRCRRPGAATRLLTYSTALGVRAALLLAGFFVGEGPRQAGGRGSTEAATFFSDLREPLEMRWLRRWQRGHDPWPCLSDPARRKEMREALLDHPQWNHFRPIRQNGEGRGGRTREANPNRPGGETPPTRRERSGRSRRRGIEE